MSKFGVIGPNGIVSPSGIIGPTGLSGHTDFTMTIKKQALSGAFLCFTNAISFGPSGILMDSIEVVFTGSESDSIFASLTEGNRYLVSNNYGSSTHVSLVDDLGKFITIRSGNFVGVAGWRDMQINKISII
jgi:hypothetical protein